MHDLEALATVVQKRAEAATRAAISALPDGCYEHRVEADGLDTHLSFPIRITVEGDEIEVDFEGAPPQMDRGGSNCTLTYTKAHATYPLKCILTPEVPGNAGCYRADAGDRAGAQHHELRPAARGEHAGAHRPGTSQPDVFGALAKAAPGRVQAFTGLPSSALFYGRRARRPLLQRPPVPGRRPGGPPSAATATPALLYPTSAGNTSVELFETRVPALVREKAFVADSGGPGRQRGGLGQVISARKLDDDGRPCQVGLYPMGVLRPVPGLFGGRPGGRAGGRTSRPGGEVRDVGVGALSVLETPAEYAELRVAGGSGFGDPLERPFRSGAARPRRGLRHRRGRTARLRLRRRRRRDDRPRGERAAARGPRRAAAIGRPGSGDGPGDGPGDGEQSATGAGIQPHRNRLSSTDVGCRTRRVATTPWPMRPCEGVVGGV